MRTIKDILVELARTEQEGDSGKASEIIRSDEFIDRTAVVAHMDGAEAVTRGALIAAGSMAAAVHAERDLESQFLEATISAEHKSDVNGLIGLLDTPVGMLFTGMVLSIGVAMGKEMNDESV